MLRSSCSHFDVSRTLSFDSLIKVSVEEYVRSWRLHSQRVLSSALLLQLAGIIGEIEDREVKQSWSDRYGILIANDLHPSDAVLAECIVRCGNLSGSV